MGDEADPPKNPRRNPTAVPTVRVPTVQIPGVRAPVVRVPTIRVPTARLPEVNTPGETKASRLVRYPNASNALRSLLEEGSATEYRFEFKKREDPALKPRGVLVEKPSPSERSKPSLNALRLIRESVNRPVREHLPTAFSQPPLPRVEATQIINSAGLGQMVRIRRQMLKLSQQELADRASVGRRFIGELEGGKPSVELGKALAVCRTLGLTLTLQAADGR
jgi:y4mF family transcriptional regulator